jgi:hypothetical protein
MGRTTLSKIVSVKTREGYDYAHSGSPKQVRTIGER